MDRRVFSLGSIALLSALQRVAAQTAASQTKTEPMHASIPSGAPQQIAMVVYPQMTALDLIGPQTLLAALGNVNVHLIWKSRELVTSDNGLLLQPTMTFADCPRDLEVLFIGGGAKGTIALMRDPGVREFLADRGARARYVTSVCTGSLLLGSAGLLRGYKATSHWAFREALPLVGAELAPGRVVEDRNRITAGGVTAGIDFGLRLAARLRDEHYAQMLQLAFEYDPQPPLHAGNPESAPAEVCDHLRSMYSPVLTDFETAAKEVRKTWPA
jgi:cyclohexyl-isocyanide hydratase